MNNDEIKQIGNEETKVSDLLRLPLWKTCVESMLAEGVAFGKTYTAEYFEERLKCKRDEMKFGLMVSQIRRALESSGFYLSGRGLKGDSFIILEPNRNQEVMGSYAAAALDALKRGVILGTNTRVDLLTEEERRRHESMLEKLAARMMFCKKTKTILKVLEKDGDSLLSVRDMASPDSSP